MSQHFLNKEEIEKYQLDKLTKLFQEIQNSNTFYKEKFSKAGFSGVPNSLTEFIKKIPFTTKDELVRDQAQNPPYGSNLTYPLSDYTRFHQTSGTMSEPIRWLDTNTSWQWMLDNWKEVFEAAGVGKKDKVFFAFSFGPFLGFWTAFEAATQLNCLTIPGGGMSSQARLKAIVENEVDAICCTPTYAIHLIDIAKENNIDLVNSKVRVIIVAGEPGGSLPSIRRKIENNWNARLFDHHGMTEIGPVTYECPENPNRLHLIEKEFICEVIDPETGLRVNEGEPGELVLTNLGRIASPLIRYRTGDRVIARREEPCTCGRYELSLEGGILGRIDNMIVVRGVNIFPSAIDQIIRTFDEVIEYRVTVQDSESMKEISIEVEFSENESNPQNIADKIRAKFREVFNLRIPVKIVHKDFLPRFEMKAKRWIQE